MEGLEGGSQLLGALRGHPGELEGRSKQREECQGQEDIVERATRVATVWSLRVKVKGKVEVHR